MAEPTLKDVLDVVMQLRDGLVRVEKDLAAHRAETAARFESVERNISAHRAETTAHRKETAKGFDELDAELEKHASRAHRDLDARVGRLEKRTAPKKVSAARPLRRR